MTVTSVHFPETRLCKLCPQRPRGLQESCEALATVPAAWRPRCPGRRHPALPAAHRGARPSPAPVRAAAPLRSCLLPPAPTRGAGASRVAGEERGSRARGAPARASAPGWGQTSAGSRRERGAGRSGAGEVRRERGAARPPFPRGLSAPWHLRALGPTLPAAGLTPRPRPRPGRGAARPPTSRGARASPPTAPRSSRGAGRPAPAQANASLGCGRRRSPRRVCCCGLLPRRPRGSRPYRPVVPRRSGGSTLAPATAGVPRKKTGFSTEHRQP